MSDRADGPVDVAITFIDVEGRACSATLTLSGEDLDSAYDASKARSNVRVSGTLVGGRHRRIVDVKGFSVIGRGRSSTAWIARFKTHQYHGSYQKFLNRDFFFDQGPILHAEMSISRVSAVFFLD